MRWDLTEEQQRRATKKFSTTEKIFDQPGQRTEQSFDVFVYAGADGIRQEVERSLRRLQTDVIDLYQTHWQLDTVPIEEKMGALEALRKEGKIRAIGVCNASPEQIDAHKRHGQLDADQELYSMLDRHVETTNLPKCAADGITFLAYSPLGQGLLTGKIGPDRKYSEHDLRHFKPRFQPENVRKVQAMLEPMRPIARRHNVALGHVVIAWTLAQRGCSHVLCGARNADQAIENAAAGSLELETAELATIAKAVQQYDGV
jgi:aryl-alcohol dehydrogenase-like predicted oxidoreductase